jgi:acyl-CoA dehydrogenase
MDFTLSDEQQAIAELADTILGEQCPPDALRAQEKAGEPLAVAAWKALAAADLLGLALPSSAGGSGLGVVEAGLVAQQVGRHVAPLPYWTSTAAALAVARWGSDDQQARWLAGTADGSSPLAVAAWGPTTSAHPDGRPAVRVASDGTLHGALSPVPWAGQATAMVVAADGNDSGEDHGDGDTALYVVPLDGPGVTRTDEIAINHEPAQTLVLEGASAERLGGGAEALHWLEQRTRSLLAATMLGMCEGALALTATHVTERQQFGAPIGTFQAVAHRAADAYIDTEAIRLTTLQALWRLDAGMDAADAVAIATYWAAEGGHRVVHAAQHLHGGIGVDVDYPVHRYFRGEKVVEALLGGRHAALARLGTALAT